MFGFSLSKTYISIVHSCQGISIQSILLLTLNTVLSGTSPKLVSL